jgi:2-polyprenyl-6-methoxyphenol hydroxylase-like FAD-dependent oxidoreductase
MRGLRSAVREAVGIEFPGTDIQAQWAVFDATSEGWNDEYGVASAHLDQPPVILTPLPGRRWRVYLRPTSDTSDLVAEASEVIGRYTPGATFADVENPTRFHCHSRVAAAFRSGPVLLAGDAAHACTPAEEPRDEHRSPGRLQSRLKARPGLPRRGARGPARHL